MSEMHEHFKMIDPLLSRLRSAPPGATYPLDPVERELILTEINVLRSALKWVVEDIEGYEQVNMLAPNPGRRYCWDSVANAHAVLG